LSNGNGVLKERKKGRARSKDASRGTVQTTAVHK